MRFLILLAFIGFNLSVPLLIDNKNLMNPNNTSSTINHKNMEHEHSSHDHAKTKTPCLDRPKKLTAFGRQMFKRVPLILAKIRASNKK